MLVYNPLFTTRALKPVTIEIENSWLDENSCQDINSFLHKAWKPKKSR
jgi:hypothetical protein